MGFTVCGLQISPPSLRQMATAVSESVHHALTSVRFFELGEYVSSELRAHMEKVRRIFDGAKEYILFTCMSMAAALLDPAPFFGAMAVGVVSNFLIEFMHGTPASSTSFFLEHAYEGFIAQTALVSVNLGCKAVQSLNFQFFPPMLREGPISAMIAGLIAGATFASAARRMYAVVVTGLGMAKPAS